MNISNNYELSLIKISGGTPISLLQVSKEAGDLSSGLTISTDSYSCWGGWQVPSWPQCELVDPVIVCMLQREAAKLQKRRSLRSQLIPSLHRQNST